MEKLAPGEVGCLAAGETFAESTGDNLFAGGREGAPISIQSSPGGRATVKAAVRFRGDHIVVRNLNFAGIERYDGYGATQVQVDGDDITMQDSDFTYPKGICMDIGNQNATDPVRADSTDGFVLKNSRVHGCGLTSMRDGRLGASGQHGVYLVNTEGARIEGNYIYDNANRGVQLWPTADETSIKNNVIDGNGSNLNIGSSGHGGDGYAAHQSERTTVENNIISNSELRSRRGDPGFPNFPSTDQANVYGYFPTTTRPDQFSNLVTRNCVYQAVEANNFEGYGYDYKERDNITGSDPRFVGRDAAGQNDDFTLRADSPCQGKGPDGVVAPNTTITSGPAHESTTTDTSVTFGFSSDPAGATFECSFQKPGEAASAYTACSSPKSYTGLGEGPHTFKVRAKDAEGGVDDSPASRTFTVEGSEPPVATCNGRRATVSGTTGTPGSDVIVGTAASETIRGLGGNDVICGGDGRDVISGGPGSDTLLDGSTRGDSDGDADVAHFSAATGAVTVNLSRSNGWASGEGSDRLFGFSDAQGSRYADTITGNELNNTLAGAGGADRITGAAGRDRLVGGSSNDVLNARLTAYDRDLAVDCGTGANDLANLDREDLSPSGCERRRRE